MFAIRRSKALACLILAACGVNVRGSDFHTKYAGHCSTADTPLPDDVEQSGAPWQAAREHFASALRERTLDLQRCYVEALALQENMQGRIVLRLSVAATGAIDQLHVIENTTGYEAFGCCVASVLRELVTPPSAAAFFEYPLVFRLVRMPLGYRTDVGSDFVHWAALPSGFELALDGAMFGGGPVD